MSKRLLISFANNVFKLATTPLRSWLAGEASENAKFQRRAEPAKALADVTMLASFARLDKPEAYPTGYLPGGRPIVGFMPGLVPGCVP